MARGRDTALFSEHSIQDRSHGVVRPTEFGYPTLINVLYKWLQFRETIASRGFRVGFAYEVSVSTRLGSWILITNKRN